MEKRDVKSGIAASANATEKKLGLRASVKLVNCMKSDVEKKRKKKRLAERFSHVKNKLQLDKSIDDRNCDEETNDDIEVKIDIEDMPIIISQCKQEYGVNLKENLLCEEAMAKSDSINENNIAQSAPCDEVKKENSDDSTSLVDISEDTEYTEFTMEEFVNQEIPFKNDDVIAFENMDFEESKPFATQQLFNLQQDNVDPLNIDDHDFNEFSANNEIRIIYEESVAVEFVSKISKVVSVPKQKLLKISEVIYKWYEIHFENGIPLTQSKILETVKRLSKEIFDDNVDGLYDTRWYQMWQQYHRIHKPLFSTEKAMPNESIAKFYKKLFEKKMDSENLQTHQMFCAQIFHLNYKTLPEKQSGKDSLPMNKRNFDRLTIMACSNVDGTLRLPLLVIGKHPELDIFTNVSTQLRPVTYLHHKSGILNGRTLDWWFKNIFAEIVKKFLSVNNIPVKALLLFERYKTFGQVRKIWVDHISIEYIDPEITRVLHPMELGIIDQIKKYYKMTLLKSALSIQSFGISLEDYLESITLRQALFQLKDAWDSVSNENIFKCWSKLLPDYFFNDVDTTLTENWKIEEFENYIRQIKGYKHINRQSVINWINSYQSPPPIPDFETLIQMVKDFNVKESNMSLEKECLISKPEAFYAVDALIQFFQEKFLMTPADINVLKKAKNAIMDHTISSLSSNGKK